MSKVVVVLVLVVVLAIIGAFFYLAFGNFPVQSQRVERVLPNAGFKK